MVTSEDKGAKVPQLKLDSAAFGSADKPAGPKFRNSYVNRKSAAKNSPALEINQGELNFDNRPTVPQMALPSFPKVEGGRDFDEEVEDRIRMT